MPVSFLPCVTPLLLLAVPFLFLTKGRRAFLAAGAASACVLSGLILAVYAPAWIMSVQGDDPVALYELARWTENHNEQIGEVIPWLGGPDVLGGYALLQKAAGKDYPPAVWLVGVRLKYGIHVPRPAGWTGPAGNVFPQPERGQRMIDRAVALGFRPPPDEEHYYERAFRSPGGTLPLLLPVVVWLGLVGTCSLVGARLGSFWPGPAGVDPAALSRRTAVVVALVGYASAARFLLARAAEMGYRPAGLQVLAVVVLVSLGLEAAAGRAYRNQRDVIGGALIGLATTLCAVGSGLPVLGALWPVFPGPVTVATFVPTFAGAVAASRWGLRPSSKPGPGG